jgi:hypothetical protein
MSLLEVTFLNSGIGLIARVGDFIFTEAKGGECFRTCFYSISTIL